MKAILPDGTQLEGTAEELARFIPRQSPFITAPPLTGLTVTMPYPCDHDFPSPWNGTVPPSCRKCGYQAASPTPYVVSTSITNEGQ